jgi:hypothetical protein
MTDWTVGQRYVVMRQTGCLEPEVLCMTTVTRLTRTQVITEEGRRWRRDNGQQIPKDNLYRRWLVHPEKV